MVFMTLLNSIENPSETYMLILDWEASFGRSFLQNQTVDPPKMKPFLQFQQTTQECSLIWGGYRVTSLPAQASAMPRSCK